MNQLLHPNERCIKKLHFSEGLVVTVTFLRTLKTYRRTEIIKYAIHKALNEVKYIPF